MGFVEAARELGAWVDDGESGAQSYSSGPSAAEREARRQRLEELRAECERREAIKQQARREQIHQILPAVKPITPDSPVGRYLIEVRNVPISPADGDLGCVDRLELFGFDGPAMIGRVSDPLDARLTVALHITWLRQDGGRWVKDDRRYLGPKKGGVIRLWPNDAVTTGLAIGEGVETSLSYAWMFQPVWAAGDKSNLAEFPVLPGIESLTIVADHDEAGLDVAAACALRWKDAGREVIAIRATTAGADLNDLIKEGA